MTTVKGVGRLTLGLAMALWVTSAHGADEHPVSTSPPGLEAFLHARVLETQGRYREAIEAYGRALQDAPDRDEVRIRYAALLLDLGLADRALEILKPAADLDWYGLRVKALVLAQVSSRTPALLKDAEAALQSALEVRDDDPNLRLGLAQVLDRAGKQAEAEEQIAALRRTHGGSPQLIAYHARLLRGLGRLSEAETAAEACAAGPSPFPPCRDLVVDLLVELGRDGDAGERLLEWSAPDDVESLLRAGALLARTGRFSQALQAVRRVQAADPGSEQARTLEGMILAATGRHDDAVDVYRELLKRNRDDVDLLMSLAWSAAAGGDLEAAREAMDRAWNVVSDHADSEAAARVCVAAARTELAAGEVLRARDWLERVGDVAAVGSQLVRLTAETYRRQEAWSDGVAALLRLAPRVDAAARREAVALEAELRLRGGDDRGRQRLRTLLDSSDPATVELALQVYQSLERWTDVETEARAALERIPGDPGIRFALGVALERQDRMDEAADVLMDLLEERPDDDSVANYLGYSWADRGLELDRARELVERALATDPDNPAYLDSMGWVRFRQGELADAEHWLRRAVDLGGTDGTILAHLGEVLAAREARGARDEAIALLTRALDAGCEHPDRVRTLLEELRAKP